MEALAAWDDGDAFHRMSRSSKTMENHGKYEQVVLGETRSDECNLSDLSSLDNRSTSGQLSNDEESKFEETTTRQEENLIVDSPLKNDNTYIADCPFSFNHNQSDLLADRIAAMLPEDSSDGDDDDDDDDDETHHDRYFFFSLLFFFFFFLSFHTFVFLFRKYIYLFFHLLLLFCLPFLILLFHHLVLLSLLRLILLSLSSSSS